MSEKPIPNLRPSLYATLYTLMVPTAREMGYALAIHGSLVNDMDLVAVPWTDRAQGDAELLQTLLKVHNLTLLGGSGVKAHGRRSWTLGWDAGLAVDLSIMPALALEAKPQTDNGGLVEALPIGTEVTGKGFAHTGKIESAPCYAVRVLNGKLYYYPCAEVAQADAKEEGQEAERGKT